MSVIFVVFYTCTQQRDIIVVIFYTQRVYWMTRLTPWRTNAFCTVDELREDADEQLFLFLSSRFNPNHVLHRLLSQPKNSAYCLRRRTHNLTLPVDVNAN